MNVRVFFKEGGYTEIRIHSLAELDARYGMYQISRIEVL
ncbi:hypothetical protein [Bacillus phage vB_BceM_Bc431v3]|uniref:Uncharacterized protein n=1 Tax=Bacillus phage vB_BceM_Bc431v3 TaxID=1195072 RepID=M4HPA0_9CAUD|nr:hypothetical protein K201_gp094 [Bacillus phage vB_BceM_Bc431v3]AFQ96402.1 hypothetical protein [Bacillus phage vB_BceM_Bc431v3]